jgi:uncharacterized protein YndB with AHSA1/START domain
MNTTTTTTQIYRIYIRATPEAIWDAITKPEWTDRYGYEGRADFELRAGGTYRHITSEGMRSMGAPEVAIDGEVVESDPPRKLVQTWRMVMDPEMAAEGFTRLTWEIKAGRLGVTKVTVIHELEGAPKLAVLLSGGLEDKGAGGGWSWVLSGLKTVLETGDTLDALSPPGQG